MPFLLIHAMLACAQLLSPRCLSAAASRFVRTIAVARAQSRWMAMVSYASADYRDPMDDEVTTAHLPRTSATWTRRP